MTTTIDKNQNADDSHVKRVLVKEAVHTEPEEAIFIKREKTSERYLKIQPYYKQKRPKSGNPTPVMPELKLCGHWLREAGFGVESYVSVTVMEGLLVIRPAKVEEG